MLKVMALLFLVFGVAISVAAEESTPDLEHELNRLIASPDGVAILDLVNRNRLVLIANPDAASLAVIALRRSGRGDRAVALAERVRIEYGAHRRLDFERAVTYWTLGNCASAKPLLRRLISDGAGDDPITSESRLFLASCEAAQAWKPDFSVSMEYDSNLGNTAPQRDITAEPGSTYHTLIESLSPLIDVPETLRLGQKPVAGIWLGLHPGIMHHRHRENGIDIYRVGVDARHANREGYDSLHARVNYNRWRKTGRFSTLTRIQASHGKSHDGADKPHRINNAMASQLRYGFDLPRHFEVSASLLAGYHESLSRDDSRIQSYDQRVGFGHRSGYVSLADEKMLSRLGWLVYLNRGTDAARPENQSGSRRSLGVEIGPIGLGEGYGGINLSHSRKRYRMARPWLRAPHKDETLTFGIDYSYPFGKESIVIFEAIYTKVTSPDPFDRGRNLGFSITFRY